jgi:hypothetical protein
MNIKQGILRISFSIKWIGVGYGLIVIFGHTYISLKKEKDIDIDFILYKLAISIFSYVISWIIEGFLIEKE